MGVEVKGIRERERTRRRRLREEARPSVAFAKRGKRGARCEDRRRKGIIGEESWKRKEEAEPRVKRREREKRSRENGKFTNYIGGGLENRRTSHSSIQPSGAMRDLF